MTATRPSKVIRFENYGVDKRSPMHHSVQPTDYRTLRPKSNSNKSYPVYDLGKSAEFEEQLLAFEKSLATNTRKFLNH